MKILVRLIPLLVATAPGLANPSNMPDSTPELESALTAMGPDYQPRTRHFTDNGSPRFTNRLIRENSPYLLQHAHNPVDWYPWGDEAFARAKQLDRPILLSIGYSTCHWCHVMEHESFEDLEIGDYINKHFVPIKVDREQRPDVDETYMTATLLINGSGGWPMTVLLTPDGKAFFAGTYFAPDRFTMLLEQVNGAWQSKRDALETQADKIMTAVREQLTIASGATANADKLAEQAAMEILARFDPDNGGFGTTPKFPNESSLLLLIDQAQRTQDPVARNAISKTLNAMAWGGIYDQLGGGFHRYATDAQWQIPHFEKMLYNQAQLARAYTSAWKLTAEAEYRRIATETLDYVLREMTSTNGVFYSATDADSKDENGHLEEGLFFVWTESEIDATLNDAEAALIKKLYSVTADGNFEGKNILHLNQKLSFTDQPEKKLWTTARAKLLRARNSRKAPLLDDKIIPAWNGMMITAFAEAADAFESERYANATTKAADHLLRSYQTSRQLDDHAFLGEALVSLYDLSGNERWLNAAVTLADNMIQRFADQQAGAFFMNDGSDDPLPIRPKDVSDNAMPSGNSAALRLLSRLHRRTGELRFKTEAQRTLNTALTRVAAHPGSSAYLSLAADELLHGETSAVQYAALGRIRIRAQRTGSTGIAVKITMKDGWHINGPKPRQTDLIPTTLSIDPKSGGAIADIEYPVAKEKTMGFLDEALLLYENEIVINATLANNQANGTSPAAVLRLQACDNSRCLPPENIRLTLGAKR